MRITPERRVLSAAGPLRRNADATREPDATVNHQQLAVGSIVQASQMGPVRRMELAHLHASIPQSGEHDFIHLGAADPIEQHLHLHALTRSLGQSIGGKI